MKKIKSFIWFVLVTSTLALIMYYGQSNVLIKLPISELSKSMYIFNKNLTLDQNDPLIIEYIQKHHLYPPSKDNYQLKHKNVTRGFMVKLQNAVKKIFNGKRNGVFVEVGACDGELLSNTLEYEMKYNWKGLLIEPNPMLTQKLINKHRKAWFADVCMSTVPFPQKVHIIYTETGLDPLIYCSGIVDSKSDSRIHDQPISEFNSSNKMIECFPIFSILSAVGFKDIDFFSLDVEGLELKILKTIPFEKINIKVFAVEFNHIPEGKQALTKFMISKGYYSPKIRSSRIDLLFIKNGYTVGNIK